MHTATPEEMVALQRREIDRLQGCLQVARTIAEDAVTGWHNVVVTHAALLDEWHAVLALLNAGELEQARSRMAALDAPTIILGEPKGLPWQEHHNPCDPEA